MVEEFPYGGILWLKKSFWEGIWFGNSVMLVVNASIVGLLARLVLWQVYA